MGLPEMYDQLLSRIRKTGEGKLVQKIFHWIACARRPLSLQELGEAIAIEPLQKSSEPERYVNDITQIPSWSRGLFTCDEEDHAMEFAHATVKEFLLGKCQNKANSGFHFQAEIVDHELGEICVTYLNFSDFERQLVKRPKPKTSIRGDDLFTANANATSGQTGVLGAVSKASQHAGNFLQRTSKPGTQFAWPRERNNITALHNIIGSYPFLQYASVHWIYHCKHFSRMTSTWDLWNRLLLSESSMLKTEWKSEDLLALYPNIANFVAREQHCGLLEWVQTCRQGFHQVQLDEIFQYSIRDTDPPWVLKRMFETAEMAPIALAQAVAAAKARDIWAIKKILDAVDFPFTEEFNGMALLVAGESDDIELVNMLLNAGADVNSLPPLYEKTALQAAVERGHFQLVARLLDAKACVNTRPSTLWATPLQAAVRRQDLEMVERLLKAGADVNAPPANLGMTALQAAAHGGNIQLVERLLHEKGHVNAPPSDFGMTALQAAAESGNPQILKMLLNEGAEVNALGYVGDESLHIAAEQVHLLGTGADVNAPKAEDWGISALYAAARCGHVEAVRKLLKAGVDVNSAKAEWPRGVTALHEAAERGHVLVVQTLLRAGADIEARMADGKTALEVAELWDRPKVVKVLRKWGAV